MKSTGEKLKEARAAKKLTRQEVADELGVSYQAVSGWEKDEYMPDISNMQKLSGLYGITIDSMMPQGGQTEEMLEITSELVDKFFDETHMYTFLNSKCSGLGFYQAQKALAFAREKHAGQVRRTKEGHPDVPYIYHPLLLACHAFAMGLNDEEIICACLLHDVVEDCHVAVSELPANDNAREIVSLLTKPEGFDNSETAEKVYYGKIEKNGKASIVKLIDRCNNVSLMPGGFSEKKMAKYIKETQDYIYPLLASTKKNFPEYYNQVFLLNYQIRSVVESLKIYMDMKN